MPRRKQAHPIGAVGVVMGSDSDWEIMQHAVLQLTAFGVPHEAKVLSAHRTPDDAFAYAETAASRGLACIIAGVTSAETIMVVGSGVFTRNFYVHFAPQAGEQRRMWVGRFAAGGILLASILTALWGGSITEMFGSSIKIVGLMGPVFWLGVTWRRANPAGAWSSLAAGIAVWWVTGLGLPQGISQWIVPKWPAAIEFVHSAASLDASTKILLTLAAQFGTFVVVSLCTRPQSADRLDPFFARLHTPVGREQEFALAEPPITFREEAVLGLSGIAIDYRKVSHLAYPGLRRIGIEIPKMSAVDWAGFLLAWATVGGLIGLLVWLASLGR